jgi:hypothetical protein
LFSVLHTQSTHLKREAQGWAYLVEASVLQRLSCILVTLYQIGVTLGDFNISPLIIKTCIVSLSVPALFVALLPLCQESPIQMRAKTVLSK